MIDPQVEGQIKALVGNGVGKQGIEALLGRPLSEEEKTLYTKCRSVFQLSEKKRRAEKQYKRQSVLERVQEHRDRVSSIDKQMDEALANIDWERRNRAETSLGEWVKTYMCDGLALNEEPSERGYEVLKDMEKAITSHKNFMICMGRGFGKSSYCICATLFAVATGKQKYVMVISHNASSSGNLLADIWRVIEVPDSAFAQDYPAICLPFSITHGAWRKRQLYHGRSTAIKKNAGSIVFATLNDEDGNPMPTSGSVITCRGIGSGIRGAKHGTLRPSLVLLDDLQDFESAQNPAQVQKTIDIINKDIMPLAGKQRLSVLQTATPIVPDDLVQKIREDKSWKTTIYPSIIKFPDRMDLWKKYFDLFDTESVELRDHDESLDFYRAHFDEMNAGADVFNPKRFSEEDGHLSAIQKLLELQHQIGDAAFQSEFQMNPQAIQFSLNITPNIVQSRKSDLKELVVPTENVQWVCASSDLNLAKYITTTIVVFFNNHTATVIYHKFRKCKIPANIPEQDYYQKVYDLLSKHGNELKALGIRIDAWAVDANGVPAKAVEDFCRNSISICGIPACGFIGKASHTYRSFLKTRLKEDVNRTLLCGDEDERRKAGSGRKWTFFDSDYYHERVQKGFLQELGNIGSLSWYDGGDHTEWSLQVCAEKLLMKRQRQDGTYEYHWRELGDHDALDSIGQALAAYGAQGFPTSEPRQYVVPMKVKKRIRIV